MKNFDEYVDANKQEVYQLENGATVLFEQTPYSKLHGLAIGVGVGSINETLPVRGVSHFLEHMLFNGTDNKSRTEILKGFEMRGSKPNAYTSNNKTVVTTKGNIEFLLDDLRDCVDMVQNARLSDEDIEKERSIILEERDMYLDKPTYLVYYELMEETFKGTPLAEPIIGTGETIRAISQDDLKEYYNNYYSANNMTFSFAADLDAGERAEVLDLIRILPPGKQVQDEVAIDPADVNTGENVVVNQNVKQAKLGLMYPVEPAQDIEEYYKREFIHQILSSGMTSILFERIREDRGLCYSVSSNYSDYGPMDTHVIRTSLSSERVDEFHSALADIWEELSDIITSENLAAAQNLLKASFLQKKRNHQALVRDNLEHYMAFGELPDERKLFTFMNNYFTLDGVGALIETLPDINNWNEVIIKQG